jgi:hypothetical protein
MVHEYHVIYSVQYYPRFHVTAVGLGTYYPWMRGHYCISHSMSSPVHFVLFEITEPIGNFAFTAVFACLTRQSQTVPNGALAIFPSGKRKKMYCVQTGLGIELCIDCEAVLHLCRSVVCTDQGGSVWLGIIRPSILPSIHLSIDPPIHSSNHPSMDRSIHSSIHPFIQSSIRPSIHSFIRPSIHSSNHPSIHPSINSSNHPSVNPSI